MKTRLILALPAHLRDPRMRYTGSVILLCILAALMGALTSPLEAVRMQCAIMVLFMVLMLFLFVKGLSMDKTVHYGSMLCVVHVTVLTCLSQTIYTSVQAWLFLLCVSHFYVRGWRAGLLWTFVSLFSLVISVVYFMQVPDAADIGFGVVHAATSFSDYLLVTLGIIVVPWAYKNRFDQALIDSEHRQCELLLRQKDLERTLQMREQFIATVSHELRTPMNAILGFNHLLLERLQGKPQARKVLEYTQQSADHLMTVINDVLDYSQFSSGRLQIRSETFELRHTVNAAFEMFTPHIENTTLRYTCEMDPDVPVWVSADRHRLMQILVNLLGNAIKFTHQGEVSLQISPHADGVVFRVSDSGLGMTPEQQEGIFERFHQADVSIQSQYGGNGLGLAISNRLTHLMGGQLGVHSALGQGAQFWLVLPLVAVPAPLARDSTTPTVPAESFGQQRRFLVVDDHPVNRLLVRQVLQRHWPEAEVVEVENGEKALQAFEQGVPWDLVLMDMVMPVMDGIEATRGIKASLQESVRRTPVVGLTANVNPQDLALFEQVGLDALLLKPFVADHLRKEVERLLKLRDSSLIR